MQQGSSCSIFQTLWEWQGKKNIFVKISRKSGKRWTAFHALHLQNEKNKSDFGRIASENQPYIPNIFFFSWGDT